MKAAERYRLRHAYLDASRKGSHIMEYRKLYNGVEIPAMGFGTSIALQYRYSESWKKRSQVKYWVKNYIRNRKQFQLDYNLPRVLKRLPEGTLIDTSRAYAGSEYLIGASGRSDQYFIVTKLCNGDQRKGKDNIRQAFERSLKELKRDFVDVYILHWPVTDYWIDSYRELEKLYEEGLVRAIGVSNCNIHHLEELSCKCNIKPMVNEFECHPLFTQDKLREYCREQEIQVLAYTSTARNDERLRKTVLVPIAKKYHKKPIQVILRWHMQIGNIPLVNTTNMEHLKDNFDIFDFCLTEEEVQQITAININSRLRYDPDNCDFMQL